MDVDMMYTHCGTTIRFGGQDAAKVQAALDQLTSQSARVRSRWPRRPRSAVPGGSSGNAQETSNGSGAGRGCGGQHPRRNPGSCVHDRCHHAVALIHQKGGARPLPAVHRVSYETAGAGPA